jgi:hypothetical protein
MHVEERFACGQCKDSFTTQAKRAQREQKSKALGIRHRAVVRRHQGREASREKTQQVFLTR